MIDFLREQFNEGILLKAFDLTGKKMTYQGNWNEPPIWSVLEGGLIATQRRDIVIAISPDHTKTMVGVLPLRPISPLAKG